MTINPHTFALVQRIEEVAADLPDATVRDALVAALARHVARTIPDVRDDRATATFLVRVDGAEYSVRIGRRA
mgnify:CR=1 FL=1